MNGIAQGFITDQIAVLLHRHGFDSVLVDIGEVRALGMRDGSHPFQVAIKESGQTLDLAEAALATSSASSLTFSTRKGSATSCILRPPRPLSMAQRHRASRQRSNCGWGIHGLGNRNPRPGTGHRQRHGRLRGMDAGSRPYHVTALRLTRVRIKHRRD